MNWEAIGAIGEIIGAAAVVATLLYLAIQSRQNNLLLREQSYYHMLQNQLSFIDQLNQDEELYHIVYKIPKNDQDAIDKMKATSFAQGLFIRWQWEYLRVREGIYKMSDVPVEAFRIEFERAHLEPYWEEEKQWLDPDFVRFMEKEVRGSGT